MGCSWWNVRCASFTSGSQAGEVHPGKVELVIQSGSALDAVRTAATAAPGLTTAQLLGCLQSWDKRYGLDIVTAESDEVGFCLLTRPDDMDSFYRELLAFCPALRASLPGPEALGYVRFSGAFVAAVGASYLVAKPASAECA